MSRIIIVGGGFAGVKCARTLRRRLSRREHEVVLFDRQNHMVFHPLLAEVAGASINPDAVAAPLRQLLPRVSCRTEDVLRIELDQRQLAYRGHDGQVRTMSYDQVVIAPGRSVNLGLIPGMADHCFPLKTIGDAMAIRAHVMQQFEAAEVADDPDRKAWYLSFLVVGGGFSGVETAGELNDLAHESHRFFRNINRDDIHVRIIHSRDQLLPEISPGLREFARVKMDQAGVDVMLGTGVEFATGEGVTLADGRTIRGATVVCTIGTMVSPVVERLAVPKNGGRLVTDPDMRLTGRQNAWAIGDCAYIINAHDGAPSPPTGQFAERQGRQAADNLVRVLRGEPTRPFRFKNLGQLCSIGGRRAVAEIFGVRMSGFLAWFLWRTVYLSKLPSWSRRLKVAFDWTWELVFSRDLAFLKTEQTERVSRAYFQAHDYVFRQGDPAANFFVIESGEVEVLRQGDDGATEVLALLGPGDFFGEMALIEDRPRNASIRARTPTEVVVMGKEVFSRISGAMASFRALIADVMKRRSANVWHGLPAARDFLSRQPLSTFVQPLPSDPLDTEATFERAITLFSEKAVRFSCIVDQADRLIGIVTRSDLLRALASGASRDTPVRDFMRADPVTVSLADSSLVAADTMRRCELTWLPVVRDTDDRRLAGYVRAEQLLYSFWQDAARKDRDTAGDSRN